jgi:HEAT repeat protein
MRTLSEQGQGIEYANFTVGYFGDKVAVLDWPQHPEQELVSAPVSYTPNWQLIEDLREKIGASLGLLPDRLLTPQEEQALIARQGGTCLDEMKALGKELRNILFPKPIWDEFNRTLEQADRVGKRLRLRLYFDRSASHSAQLVQLPWELLYIQEWEKERNLPEPELFPFLAWNVNISLVHQPELESRETQHTGAMPLRVLLVMAEPKAGYWSRFPLDRLKEEYECVCNVLRRLEQEGLVQVEELRNPSPKQLQEKLTEGFHVIHYFGHAYFQETDSRIPREDDLSQALWQQVREGGGLVLVGEDGKAAYLPAEKLVQWVKEEEDPKPGSKKARLRLVVLNACKTARDDPKATPHGAVQRRGVAYRLFEAGVPAVVAMRHPVPDVSGPLFAEEFYRGLANWLPIDACVAGARAALSRPPRDEYPDWSLPVVFLRSESGRLFAPWEEIWREQYLQFVRDRYRYMKSIDPDRELLLEEFYIPLQVGERVREEKARGPSAPPGASFEEGRIYDSFQVWRERAASEEPRALRPLKIEQALQKSPIVILGDPGSGKSTLEEHLALKYASEEGSRRKVPVLIKLPHWWMYSGYDPIRYAATLYVLGRIPEDENQLSPDAEQRRDNFEEVLRGWVNAGECIWLFDGLDEVTRKRDELTERLQDLAEGLLRRCSIVVTSRIASYDENRLKTFKHFEIMPLNPRQTDRLIDLWFQGEAEKAGALKSALKANAQMSVLATNPLLLTVICFVFDRNRLRLPARRGELYEHAVRELLKISGRTDIPEEYPPAHKRFILEEIALYFFKKGKEIFDDHELLTQIEKIAKRKGYKGPKDGFYIREDIICNSGLLFKGADGRYLFLHLTFQEYLAACALTRRTELKEENDGKIPEWLIIAKSRFWDSRWEEVIRLLAAKLEDGTPLIQAILKEKDNIFHNMLLLAGKCMADARRVEPSLKWWVAERILLLWRRGALPKLRRMESLRHEAERVLALLLPDSETGVFPSLIHFLRYESRYSFAVRASAIRVLWQAPGTLEAVSRLLSILLDKRESLAIKRIAAGALSAIATPGDEAVIGKLLPILKNPFADSWMRSFAASILAEVGDRQALMSALIDVLKSAPPKPAGDFDPIIRTAAAQILGELGDERAASSLSDALSFEPIAKLFYAYVQIGGSDPAAFLKNMTFSGTADQTKDDGLVPIRPFPGSSLTVRVKPDQVLRLYHMMRLLDGNTSMATQISTALGIGPDPIVETILRNLKDFYETAKESYDKAGSDFHLNFQHRVDELLKMAESGGKLKELDIRKAFSQMMYLDGRFSQTKVNMTLALAKLGRDDAKDRLVRYMRVAKEEENSVLMIHAGYALAELGNSRGVEELIDALKHRSRDIRKAAAIALGNIKDATAGEALLFCLKRAVSEKEISVAQVTAEALGKLGYRPGVATLCDLADHPEAWIRWGARLALCEIAEPSTLELLIGFLKDPLVRAPAARGLAKIGDAKAIPPLIECLTTRDRSIWHEHDAEIREVVFTALKQLSQETGVCIYPEDVGWAVDERGRYHPINP